VAPDLASRGHGFGRVCGMTWESASGLLTKGGSTIRFLLALFAGALVVAVGGSAHGARIELSSSATSVVSANVWVGASGSCKRSATPAAYNTATACATLDAAYHAAAMNDTVDVKCGTYGSQAFSYDSSKTGGTVTFQPESAGCVTINGSPVGISLKSNVGYLTIKGFVLNGPDGAVQDAGSGVSKNVTIDGNKINVGKKLNGCCDVSLHAIDGWKIVNNTIGPSCCGKLYNSSPVGLRIGKPSSTAPNSNNVLIDNNLLQNVVRNCSYWPTSGFGFCPDTTCISSGCHSDGIHIWGLQNSTISRNRIYNAEVAGIFLEQANLSLNKNISIVSNAVRTVGGSSGIYVKANGSNAIGGTWNIAFNSVVGLIMVPGTGFTGVAAGTVINLIGNAGSLLVANSSGNNAGCTGAAAGLKLTYSYNVWNNIGGATVGPCGSTDVAGATSFVNTAAAPQVGVDLHLAAATQSADNRVPSTNCTAVTTKDFDGQTRPMGTKCDAGADER
jgi:hypothetical protein